MTVQTQATARWVWIARLATAVVLALAGVIGATQTASARGTLCSSPNYGFSCVSFSGYSGQSTWGYPVDSRGHNCTNYAAFRLSQNKMKDPGNLGYAKDWANNARSKGFTVNSTPAVGAIAQWNAWAPPAYGSGHVAYIEAITSTYIDVTDDNFLGTTGRFRYYRGQSDWPSNFIHFKDVSSNFQPFAGDFNGDGIGDIGFRRVDTGKFYLRYGPSFTTQTVYDWSDGPGFQPFVTDVNGDSKDDIGIRNIATGVYYIRESPSFMTQVTYHWSVGTNYEPIGGDFNGDGIGDIGIRNIATGKFYLRYGPSFASSQSTYDWSDGPGFQPFVVDINGDGKDDLGIRKISTGTYYIRHSPSFTDQTVSDWSNGPGFQPFAGDFNGDGIGDIGIRNIATGKWYMRYGPTFTSQTTVQWSQG